MVAIRKNVKTLPTADIERFAKACKELKATGEYDTFIKTHYEQMGIVHGRPAVGSPYFLPWHRAFLMDFEKRVQRVLGDPSFGLPYWDWTEDYDGRTNIGPVWDADRLGGSGSPVTTGPFLPASWKVAMMASQHELPSGGDVGLCRGLGSTNSAYTQAVDVHRLFADATYQPFYGNLEYGPHGRMHVWVGGQMEAVANSPNDPVFWMHHANVDRIWSQWQKIYPTATITATDPAYPEFKPTAEMPPTYDKAGVLPVDRVTDVVGTDYGYDAYNSIKELVLKVWTGRAYGSATNDKVTATLTFTVEDKPGVPVAVWSSQLLAANCDNPDPFERGSVDTFTFTPATYSRVTNAAALTPACLDTLTISLQHESWWTGAWDLLEVKVLAVGASRDSGVINQTLSNSTTTSVTVPLLPAHFTEPAAPTALIAVNTPF
jgi:tyrosinase